MPIQDSTMRPGTIPPGGSGGIPPAGPEGLPPEGLPPGELPPSELPPGEPLPEGMADFDFSEGQKLEDIEDPEKRAQEMCMRNIARSTSSNAREQQRVGSRSQDQTIEKKEKQDDLAADDLQAARREESTETHSRVDQKKEVVYQDKTEANAAEQLAKLEKGEDHVKAQQSKLGENLPRLPGESDQAYAKRFAKLLANREPPQDQEKIQQVLSKLANNPNFKGEKATQLAQLLQKQMQLSRLKEAKQQASQEESALNSAMKDALTTQELELMRQIADAKGDPLLAELFTEGCDELQREDEDETSTDSTKKEEKAAGAKEKERVSEMRGAKDGGQGDSQSGHSENPTVIAEVVSYSDAVSGLTEVFHTGETPTSGAQAAQAKLRAKYDPSGKVTGLRGLVTGLATAVLESDPVKVIRQLYNGNPQDGQELTEMEDQGGHLRKAGMRHRLAINEPGSMEKDWNAGGTSKAMARDWQFVGGEKVEDENGVVSWKVRTRDLTCSDEEQQNLRHSIGIRMNCQTVTEDHFMKVRPDGRVHADRAALV